MQWSSRSIDLKASQSSVGERCASCENTKEFQLLKFSIDNIPQSLQVFKYWKSANLHPSRWFIWFRISATRHHASASHHSLCSSFVRGRSFSFALDWIGSEIRWQDSRNMTGVFGDEIGWRACLERIPAFGLNGFILPLLGKQSVFEMSRTIQ